MADLFIFKPGDIVQRPDSIEPYSNTWKNNVTWVEMKPKQIINQGTSGRGGVLTTGKEGPTFKFLAPPTIAENIGHTWAAYDSIQSRIADKAIGASKLGKDVTSILGGFKNIGSSLKGLKGSNYGTALENIVREAYTSVAGHNVPKIKVDKPMIYQDSARRELVLEFHLIAETDNVKRDVLDVVQDLQKYSCAGIDRRSAIDIEFPYYFEVKTTPGEAINYTTCALKAVQSTYDVPWSVGFPSHCTLQLTFEDISPLFRQTIQSGSIINVISKPDNTAFNQDPSATTIGNNNAQRRREANMAAPNTPPSAKVGPGQNDGSHTRI